ncbi:hypothetical protein BpHYR1_021854 [Brachionus plicatilis]|uniref:Uncharacterized protein n=1 Tax=Brachionus plicatilis TaxID=10195 RepID=A0A3M7T3Z5_BRAPC|nr:hypothetical protein BpHYR1_021854 [Brachionus plicatilis]
MINLYSLDIPRKVILIFMLKKNYAQITKIDLDFSRQKTKKSHFDFLVLPVLQYYIDLIILSNKNTVDC